MHEVSLAGGVLRTVEESAARDPFRRVLRLRLDVGSLSGVDIHALEFALASIAPGTLLEGAEIEIVEPPGRAWCMACSQHVSLVKRGDACQHCGGFQLIPSGGTDLRIVDLEVSDASDPADVQST